MVITLTTKPVTGNISRVCHVCGDPYRGWNFIACPACEPGVTFVRNY